MTDAEIQNTLALADTRLGRAYLLGAKWALADKDPQGPIDCSGFSRWVLWQAGIVVPDGSYNQIKVCTKIPASIQKTPPPLCLGFYEGSGGAVDHVVIARDDVNVIEARGVPYNAVINRPIAKWLAQPGFLGFYAPPGISYA